jgi:flagellar basal-body rod protein FlgC
MNIVAENIANAETTSTPEGGPYRRRLVEVNASSERLPFNTILKRSQGALVRTNRGHMPAVPTGLEKTGEVAVAQAKELTEGKDSYRLVYDPGHPDADEEGYVKMPDIEIINEMVDMMTANRAYEANTLAISASKEMLKNALNI